MVAVWCASRGKKTRFHLLSQLGCSDQAWTCQAGTPQQPGLYNLHYIMPFPSYSVLLGPPFPWSSLLANEQLIPKYFYNTGPTFVISIHKSEAVGCMFLSHLILVWYFRCALFSLQDTTLKRLPILSSNFPWSSAHSQVNPVQASLTVLAVTFASLLNCYTQLFPKPGPVILHILCGQLNLIPRHCLQSSHSSKK